MTYNMKGFRIVGFKGLCIMSEKTPQKGVGVGGFLRFSKIVQPLFEGL